MSIKKNIIKRALKLHNWLVNRQKKKTNKLRNELKQVFAKAYGYQLYWQQFAPREIVEDFSDVTKDLAKLCKVNKKELNLITREHDIKQGRYKYQSVQLKNSIRVHCINARNCNMGETLMKCFAEDCFEE